MGNPEADTKRLKAVIAKYRKSEYPGEWFLTDFTMEQVERRLEQAKAELSALALGNLKAQHRAAKVNARLREALEWYANEDTYRDYYPLTAVPYRRAHILDDAGQRARDALAGGSERETPDPE